MENSIKILKELTYLDAVAGFEKEVAEYLIKNLSPYADEIRRDNLGGVYAYKYSKNPNSKTLMIAAHMDEIGFMITKILPNGFLKFETLGGFREDTLLTQKFTITTCEGKKFVGVIPAVPKHFISDKEMGIKISEMVIDVGAESENDVRSWGIKEGDIVTPRTEFERLTENRILAKAFDNRYGCALIIEVLKELSTKELDCNLVVCSTVQEEVGLRGASIAANMVKPDLALIVDCSPANDMGMNREVNGKLGEGFLVRLMDRTMILRGNLREKIIGLAQKNEIKYQYFTSPGGTDAGAIHQSLLGIPTAVIGICGRYIHSHNSMIDIRDYLSAKAIVKHITEELNDEFIKYIRL
ncbi:MULTISPECIES: M42 family metallopeptidase [unclassified Gemella]|uniref:M42 family metallopeptidase n=1 Tax=unclassified Gemella TaxID=2624949 RepID=UPI001073CFCB|nr:MULTISPECIES: M42 family metallopeptidase [unclassified Gemella]MBF0710099.1 M42 family metallopeptidase [Gemella sp. GL1.1]MBF0746178.1 M42 family metallopeptidase [Gemella sp. 19428wG2_WT2a]NYS27443.1 M42 family metallopeptidase [Gemella sp. GL1]TFU60463.1 M42 family peptidase [Gemella sp. WT2a]